ncbi:MAG TPA: hypothetical protein VF978_01210 [Gemmatimonadales bacterium]
MTPTRKLLSALLGSCAALAALSCADPAPLGVQPGTADAGLLGLDLPAGLLSCSPLPYESVAQTIDATGGTLQVGPHTFSVPPGALDTAVTITAVAPSGTVNSIQFQPEGLIFAEPASLTMSYANCDLLGLTLPKRIAHTTDDLLAILAYVPSVASGPAQVTGRIDHFSTYAVAW